MVEGNLLDIHDLPTVLTTTNQDLRAVRLFQDKREGMTVTMMKGSLPRV
jgi:hypothetical protein